MLIFLLDLISKVEMSYSFLLIPTMNYYLEFLFIFINYEYISG